MCLTDVTPILHPPPSQRPLIEYDRFDQRLSMFTIEFMGEVDAQFALHNVRFIRHFPALSRVCISQV